MLQHRSWNVWVRVVRVGSIRRAIVVVIGVASITLAVMVEVGLRSVGIVHAVVVLVRNAVVILIVTRLQAASVGLVGVAWEIIGTVGYAIAVYVTITSIALAVLIHVILVWVGDTRTVVLSVGGAVLIAVGFISGWGMVSLAIHYLTAVQLVLSVYEGAVAAGTAVEMVLPPIFSVQAVVARVAVKVVLTSATIYLVIPDTAVNSVSATATIYLVIPDTTVNSVSATVTTQHVGPIFAEYLIGSLKAADGVRLIRAA
jgi:hypothetical protein